MGKRIKGLFDFRWCGDDGFNTGGALEWK